MWGGGSLGLLFAFLCIFALQLVKDFFHRFFGCQIGHVLKSLSQKSWSTIADSFLNR
jgi:hypothetical protein